MITIKISYLNCKECITNIAFFTLQISRFLFPTTPSHSLQMRSTPIPSALFSKNRSKLFELMIPGSVVLVGSNDQMPRNGDQYFPFRQHSNFYYLTGINQEESVVVLTRDDNEKALQEVIFIRKATPKSTLWSGPGYTLQEAASQSGIKQVKWLDELDEFLGILIPKASIVYVSGKISDKNISERFSDISISQLAPLLTRLRMVKEGEEVAEIRKACSITHSAFLRVLKMMKPGIWEYEAEAEIIAEFISRGAEGHAYEPILAGGKNALILHYVQNNAQCSDGDLLLMDFGAELNNYAADCSRTIPVNGNFTARQREVYGAVLRIFKTAMELMVPGILLNDFHNQVGKMWEEEHIRLGLYTLEEVAAQPKDNPLWKRYFMHGTTHSLGLDVHDPFDRTQPFQPGMILTCEPAIYLPDEGIGIRLENDILITDEGPVDLMDEIPIEAEEIEELMQSND